MTFPLLRQPAAGLNRQRGMATLFIALVLLAILTIVVIFATNVGVFEQRTAANENRARITQQTAEGGVNLGAEFIKANVGKLTSTTAGGWMAPGAGRWVPCTTGAPTGQFDACDSITSTPNADRAQMYRYQNGNSTALNLGGVMPTGTGTALARLEAVDLGGGAQTPATTTVGAVLCRLDSTDLAQPVCALNPADESRVAVTLVANVAVGSEESAAQVKETIGSFRVIGGAATVPLVASGMVNGLGSAEIVANPNAGGTGVEASIWAPTQVNIDGGGGGGIGSVATCHMGEFLGSNDIDDVFTACAGNSCGCPSDDFLSGHFGSVRQEGSDILDVDGNQGANPDITFFPREPLDNPNDPLDDSLFEWIFQQDVVVEGQVNVDQSCSPTADCAKNALEGLSAVLTNCSDLSAASTGLYWAQNGCNLPAVVGSPKAPVVLVIDNDLQLNGNVTIFGILFIRSSTNAATFRGNGDVTIFGSTIVEGAINTNGSIRYIYSEKIAKAIQSSPDFQRFGKVPGSWLDAAAAF